VQGLADGPRVVTRNGLQQSFLDQDVNLGFPQLDRQTPQPETSSFAGRAHTFGRG
jgi:hypothetical protein